MKDDGVVDDELSVGTKFFRNSILVRIALGFHFVEINLKKIKEFFIYSGHRLMGSLWDQEKLIPITD